MRRYRAALASRERPGFGMTLEGDAALAAGSLPRVRDASSELVVVAPRGRRGVVQLASGRTARADGDWRLDRAAYTQLTEGGPLARVAGDLGGAAVASTADAFAVAFGEDDAAAEAEASALARGARALVDAELAARAAAPRAASWLLDCVACDAGEGAVALLADHVILPLVWTRDAYYVASALLAGGGADGRRAVEAFVRWCFERAERVDGRWWPRSSLATGEAKDRAFQLDQQLYPLLLVAELGGATRERYAPAAREQLEAVLARADGGLVATSETPADDRLEQPFHFSSHVLLWRVLRAYGRDAAPLAARIRDAFTHDGRFAYAVGRGVRHYHDANDLPTVLAPEWGFCSADDPLWRATIAHAWSAANEAYFAGPLGGLGSLHTPHPWALGDLQRVIVARATADAALARDAAARLDRVSTWDGLLAEAYDERDGAVASRHWFAWPVALRASLLP